MFIVTNRNLVEGKSGTEILGDKVNAEGPGELRILEATRLARGFEVKLLPDTITEAMKREAGITEPGRVFASRYMFQKLLAVVNPKHGDRASRKKGKDLLLFVHGFNNSFAEVLERCHTLAGNFGLEVVAYTWPANGGGIKGVADYLDDKRDAQASVVAFDRVLAKSFGMLREARERFLAEITLAAAKRHPESGERQRELVARESERNCPFRVTMLLHSMGNYLFERTLKSTALRGELLVFDNIVLCAADVNNPGHAEWVDQIQFRNRLYVTINEDDFALKASRLKGGDEQLARLGHYRFNLNATQAIYVDFTNAQHVGSSHAYFEENALKNQNVRKFFERALSGDRPEEDGTLIFDPAQNLYRLRA